MFPFPKNLAYETKVNYVHHKFGHNCLTSPENPGVTPEGCGDGHSQSAAPTLCFLDCMPQVSRQPPRWVLGSEDTSLSRTSKAPPCTQLPPGEMEKQTAGFLMPSGSPKSPRDQGFL